MLTRVSTARHRCFKKDADLGGRTEEKGVWLQIQNEVIQTPRWLPQLSSDKLTAIRKRCLKNVNLLSLTYLSVSSNKGKDIKNPKLKHGDRKTPKPHNSNLKRLIAANFLTVLWFKYNQKIELLHSIFFTFKFFSTPRIFFFFFNGLSICILFALLVHDTQSSSSTQHHLCT